MCFPDGICYFWPQNAFLPHRNVEGAAITRSWKIWLKIAYGDGGKVTSLAFGPKPRPLLNQKDANHGMERMLNFLLRMILTHVAVSVLFKMANTAAPFRL